MHPRPIFAFKLDFKSHSRSPSFIHHFLCFKAWLASNWSQKNWFIMFIQSIKCSSIEFDQLGFWPDLRVRGLTNLQLMKFNQALKQSLMTMENVFEVSIWSIMAPIAQFYFWIGNFPFSFLPNLSTILQVLYLIVFSSSCSFQRYIICGFSSHGSTITIFELLDGGSTDTVARVIVAMTFSNLVSLHFDFLIGVLHLLIFLFLFYF
jgi:hypothetical protein